MFWHRPVLFSGISLKTVSTVASLRRSVQHALAPLAPTHTFVCSRRSFRRATKEKMELCSGQQHLMVH